MTEYIHARERGVREGGGEEEREHECDRRREKEPEKKPRRI